MVMFWGFFLILCVVLFSLKINENKSVYCRQCLLHVQQVQGLELFQRSQLVLALNPSESEYLWTGFT